MLLSGTNYGYISLLIASFFILNSLAAPVTTAIASSFNTSYSSRETQTSGPLPQVSIDAASNQYVPRTLVRALVILQIFTKLMYGFVRFRAANTARTQIRVTMNSILQLSSWENSWTTNVKAKRRFFQKSVVCISSLFSHSSDSLYHRARISEGQQAYLTQRGQGSHNSRRTGS